MRPEIVGQLWLLLNQKRVDRPSSHIYSCTYVGGEQLSYSLFKSYPLTPSVLGLERDISFYATSIIFIFRQRTLTATSGEHSHVDVNIN